MFFSLKTTKEPDRTQDYQSLKVADVLKDTVTLEILKVVLMMSVSGYSLRTLAFGSHLLTRKHLLSSGSVLSIWRTPLCPCVHITSPLFSRSLENFDLSCERRPCYHLVFPYQHSGAVYNWMEAVRLFSCDPTSLSSLLRNPGMYDSTPLHQDCHWWILIGLDLKFSLWYNNGTYFPQGSLLLDNSATFVFNLLFDMQPRLWATSTKGHENKRETLCSNLLFLIS